MKLLLFLIYISFAGIGFCGDASLGDLCASQNNFNILLSKYSDRAEWTEVDRLRLKVIMNSAEFVLVKIKYMDAIVLAAERMHQRVDNKNLAEANRLIAKAVMMFETIEVDLRKIKTELIKVAPNADNSLRNKLDECLAMVPSVKHWLAIRQAKGGKP